ncbi:MAG: hypothetical protein CME08_00700, partial [Gemmatimonadetes bacterium]|nr:hypothetical protein [Gemmatimonadota bacterium]
RRRTLSVTRVRVGGWNKWRANNPRKETLHRADLSGKDLIWAELSGIVAELNLPRPASTEEPAALTLPRTAVEPSPDRGA